MIAAARIIEAWRDAKIFNRPTDPRGFWWHAFKFPQYGLWLSSLYLYSNLFFGIWAFVAVGLDVLIAWPVFEFFLAYFRKRFRNG